MIGLTVTEKVAGKAGTFIKYRELNPTGQNEKGQDTYEVVFCFYESKAKFLAGDPPIKARDENKRVTIAVKAGTTMSDEIIYENLKTPLAEAYTLAGEKS